MKFAINDKAITVYPENLQQLQEIAMALRGKKIYIGNEANILEINNPTSIMATIRIECEDYKVMKKPGT